MNETQNRSDRTDSPLIAAVAPSTNGRVASESYQPDSQLRARLRRAVSTWLGASDFGVVLFEERVDASATDGRASAARVLIPVLVMGTPGEVPVQMSEAALDGSPFQIGDSVALREASAPGDPGTSLEPVPEPPRAERNGRPAHRRFLATVMFTDIVDSTGRADSMGDGNWLDLLERHDAIVRDLVGEHGGVVDKTTGDGALARFATPINAIVCARALRDALRALGLTLHCGIHVGEIEERAGVVGGIAINIASRIVEKAAPGEILVSRTVTDLVAGADVAFFDRGEQEMRGTGRSWRLFAVE